MDYPGKVITKTQVTPTQTSATGVWTLDDAAAATRNNNWPVAGVPNPISKSLRFNSADSAYLNRTPASATNRRTFTWSGWFKRCNPATTNTLFSAYVDANNFFGIRLREEGDNGRLEILNYSSAYDMRIETTQVFRDVSAWYHLVVAIDTTQATSTDRVKLYLNGSQITALSTTTYPNQNFDTDVNNTNAHYVGSLSTSQYHNGYLTEVNFIDGQALTPSSFGMTDPVTGVWEPLKYSGTYGTNGFYLNFKDATSTTTLGLDYSGNSNTWTTNNFSVTAGSGNDSLTDVPTPWIPYNTTGDVGGVIRGNYATLNPLTKPASATISNGNLDTTLSTTSGSRSVASTFYQDTSSWYWEAVATTVGNNSAGIGIANTSFVVGNEGGTGCYFYLSDGRKVINNTYSSYGASWIANDVIGVAFDATNGTITFYKNGSSQGQITGIPTGVLYTPFVCSNTSVTASVFVTNFGQRPFAYTPPSGFRSLCTTNLPASTVLKGTDYFDINLWTGTGATNTITNSGSMQPDFVWIKSRSTANSHRTAAEATESDSLTSFNSNGFTLGADTSGGGVNVSTRSYVGWQWKANGAGVTNTAGTITSTVSANTTSGFSIVRYGVATGSNATVGHGLGVAPSMIIIKGTNLSAWDWAVYHASLGNTQYLALNTTAAAATSSAFWNNTSPTSTVFSIGTNSSVNANTYTYIAYCFAPISGFSAFGSYTGNGSTDGPFVYLGFRPAFVMVKVSSGSARGWSMWDDARSIANGDSFNYRLEANSSAADDTGSGGGPIDLLSNGFKIRNTAIFDNESGSTFIYACFAENPFKNALAR